MKIDKSLGDTMFWEPITIETAAEANAVIVAAADVAGIVTTYSESDRIPALEACIQNTERMLPGIGAGSPKPVGFDNLISFYTFWFATVSLAFAKQGG